MVKQIIKEAMDQNPLGLKEAVEEELRARVIAALEEARKKMAEEDEDMDDGEDEDDDDEDEDEDDGDEDEDDGDEDEDDDLEEVNLMRKMSPAKMAKLQKARLDAAVAKATPKSK